MGRVYVATPLGRSIVSSHSFCDDIVIGAIDSIEWNIAGSYFSQSDFALIKESNSWLYCSRETDNPYADDCQDLFRRVRNALLTLQVLYPFGARNAIFKFIEGEQFFDYSGHSDNDWLCSSLVGRISSVEANGLSRDFEAMYRGISEGFSASIPRLRNPISLLCQAQSTKDVSLSTLMTVMGLDMIVMGRGKLEAFVDCICGFLGAETLVFPAMSELGWQATTTVGEVTEELYKLRNLVAHGCTIPDDPYRQPFALLDRYNRQINMVPHYCYLNLLHDSGLFLLTAAIRRIVLDSLLGDIVDDSRWRRRLQLYTRRHRATKLQL